MFSFFCFLKFGLASIKWGSRIERLLDDSQDWLEASFLDQAGSAPVFLRFRQVLARASHSAAAAAAASANAVDKELSPWSLWAQSAPPILFDADILDLGIRIKLNNLAAMAQGQKLQALADRVRGSGRRK